MQNFLGFLVGALCASPSIDVAYDLVSSGWLPQLDILVCIAIWVILGFLLGKASRALPGLPVGYALFVLRPILPGLHHVGSRLCVAAASLTEKPQAR